MLEFSDPHRVFMVFTEERGGVTETLLEWERDADVLVAISYRLIVVEKSVLKLQPSEAAIQERHQKIIYIRNETKSVSIPVTQFLVNILFCT